MTRKSKGKVSGNTIRSEPTRRHHGCAEDKDHRITPKGCARCPKVEAYAKGVKGCSVNDFAVLTKALVGAAHDLRITGIDGRDGAERKDRIQERGRGGRPAGLHLF